MATAVAANPAADPALAACPTLAANASILDKEELRLAHMLLQEDQAHLFSQWPPAGARDADKHAFFAHIGRLDTSYGGGLGAYIRNARRLLAASKAGENPFEGLTPRVPRGTTLAFGSPEFCALEESGLDEMAHAAFMLVAGGLGERLGYSGVKIALPAETLTGASFLEYYAKGVLAAEARNRAKHPGSAAAARPIPFAIMTSDDTHRRTLDFLESHGRFGLQASQVHVLKQEKVACLSDAAAHLAQDGPFGVSTKPHGHGDVHSVLHASGLLAEWKSQGRKWVIFYQDTNALVFKALPSALGVSARDGLEVNSLAVPRRAKESIGAIAELVRPDGTAITINVEYNQLDPLLRASYNPEGDVNDPATGMSPFPGNINQLIFSLPEYEAELQKTHGVISEFVNPKYADASRTVFKSSTRLECMMQDYPKTLSPTAKVGFTVMPVWAAYSPVKNSAADARTKHSAGEPSHSATSGELDLYAANAAALREIGVRVVGGPGQGTFNGMAFPVGPLVALLPSFALSFSELRSRFPTPADVTLTSSSALVLEGDVIIHGLQLDGGLEVRAPPGGAAVVPAGAAVANAGARLRPLGDAEARRPRVIVLVMARDASRAGGVRGRGAPRARVRLRAAPGVQGRRMQAGRDGGAGAVIRDTQADSARVNARTHFYM